VEEVLILTCFGTLSDEPSDVLRKANDNADNESDSDFARLQGQDIITILL
jgi:hypothetical protein